MSMNGWVAAIGEIKTPRKELEKRIDVLQKRAVKHGCVMQVMYAKTWNEQTLPFIRVVTCGGSNQEKLTRLSEDLSSPTKMPSNGEENPQ